MSAGFAVSYGFMFAGVTALIVHTILYYSNVNPPPPILSRIEIVYRVVRDCACLFGVFLKFILICIIYLCMI